KAARRARRRRILSATRLGGPGPRQPRLAGAHHDPQSAPPPAGSPPPTAPSTRRRGGDQPDRHGRRVISPRSLRPEPFTPLLGRHPSSSRALKRECSQTSTAPASL